jgi:hypothetical protein
VLLWSFSFRPRAGPELFTPPAFFVPTAVRGWPRTGAKGNLLSASREVYGGGF